MATKVNVSGISSQTGEKEIKDFFSFCGKIQSLSVQSDGANEQKATVTFEKETAAKTALLLDNTQLGPAQVHVTADTSSQASSATADAHDDATGDELYQEDKPRARIVAEYLAHGYVLGDNVIDKAIQLDHSHGYSKRFLNSLSEWDKKVNATEKASAVDQKLGVSNIATAGWQGISSFFDKAIGTPTGQKVRNFYVQGQKQVIDVHNEARHLADLKAGKNATSETSYDKSSQRTPAEAEMKTHADGKTSCNCAGVDSVCPCQPGSCTCNSCPKTDKAATAA